MTEDDFAEVVKVNADNCDRIERVALVHQKDPPAWGLMFAETQSDGVLRSVTVVLDPLTVSVAIDALEGGRPENRAEVERQFAVLRQLVNDPEAQPLLNATPAGRA